MLRHCLIEPALAFVYHPVSPDRVVSEQLNVGLECRLGILKRQRCIVIFKVLVKLAVSLPFPISGKVRQKPSLIHPELTDNPPRTIYSPIDYKARVQCVLVNQDALPVLPASMRRRTSGGKASRIRSGKKPRGQRSLNLPLASTPMVCAITRPSWPFSR